MNVATALAVIAARMPDASELVTYRLDGAWHAGIRCGLSLGGGWLCRDDGRTAIGSRADHVEAIVALAAALLPDDVHGRLLVLVPAGLERIDLSYDDDHDPMPGDCSIQFSVVGGDVRVMYSHAGGHDRMYGRMMPDGQIEWNEPPTIGWVLETIDAEIATAVRLGGEDD